MRVEQLSFVEHEKRLKKEKQKKKQIKDKRLFLYHKSVQLILRLIYTTCSLRSRYKTVQLDTREVCESIVRETTRAREKSLVVSSEDRLEFVRKCRSESTLQMYQR